MVLKRIDVVSAAKIGGILYAAMGLILGGLVSLFGFFGALLNAGQSGGTLLGLFFGVASVITLPLFYGAMGVVVSALSALLYNVVAGRVGGLQIELE